MSQEVSITNRVQNRPLFWKLLRQVKPIESSSRILCEAECCRSTARLNKIQEFIEALTCKPDWFAYSDANWSFIDFYFDVHDFLGAQCVSDSGICITKTNYPQLDEDIPEKTRKHSRVKMVSARPRVGSSLLCRDEKPVACA